MSKVWENVFIILSVILLIVIIVIGCNIIMQILEDFTFELLMRTCNGF